MHILFWIILGGLAGWIASMIADTNKQMGIVANIAVGIVGALLGGFLMQLLGGSSITGFNLYSIAVAVVGSVILLALLRLLGGFRAK